jgi:hypothetical protein
MGMDHVDTTFGIDQRDATVIDDTRIPPFQPSAVDPCFIENLGQLDDDDVTYYAPGSSVSVGFGPGWVSYAVRNAEDQGMSVFRAHFMGCNQVVPKATGLEGHPTSYFIGAEEDDWVIGARSFKRVTYQDLYDGIDLEFYFKDGCLKYDLVVAPGGNPSQFRLSYEGVESLGLEDGTGDLIVTTAHGTVRDSAPTAYQPRGDNLLNVPAGFHLGDDGTLGFRVGPHNPRLPLVIDPALAFSTYLGGSKEEYHNDMAVNASGCMLLTGHTYSSNFPTKAGSYDRSYANYQDAFVVKLSRDGRSLEYSTFLGSTGTDVGESICIDSADCAYITGMTGGGSYPTTAGAYDRSLDRGEAFVTKLNKAGTDLVFSTYLGGSNNEHGYGICLDSLGNVCIHGSTTSNTDFPVTTGCYDRYYNGGDTDSFFAKLNSAGTKLLYGTYLGGSAKEYPKEVAVDTKDNVYLMGHSLSTNFPITPGAYDRYHGGRTDIFVTKLNTSSSTLAYSTFVGWMGVENGVDLFIDSAGCAYVPGLTDSLGFPTTQGAYQTTHGGWHDAFCFKLNAAGSGLVFSTLLGKSEWDQANGVWVASNGTVWIAGNTGSRNFPTTAGAYCRTYAGNTDAFLTGLSKDGSSIIYSTFIGGGQWDRAQRVEVREGGSFYVAGHTLSTDFPTTKGAFDRTHASARDLFAFMLDLGPPEVWGDVLDPYATTGDPFNFSINASDNSAVERMELEYWHGSPPPHTASPHEWINMTLINGTTANGTWKATVNASNNSIENLNFVLHASDIAGNKMDPAVSVVLTYDNDRPLLDDLTVDQATTGDTHTIRVNVTDNIGSGEVRVIYWFGDKVADAVNVTMAGEDLTGLGNGTYVRNITVPWNPRIRLHYRIFANDSSGNWNLSDVRHIDILDNDGPRITALGVPESATIGKVLTLNVSVLDNVGVDLVWLEYWYGDNPSEATNVSLSPVETDAWGNGTYACTLAVDTVTLEMLHLVFKAIDLGANVNATAAYGVTVNDGDRPWFGEDHTPGNATTGDPLHISIEVFDNIGVDSVWVQYWYGRGRAGNATLVKGTGDAWNGAIVVNHTHLELYYVIGAKDTSGNLNWTLQRELPVIDNDRPEILSDATGTTATTGDPLTLAVEARDNLAMGSMEVEYWFEGGEPTRAEMAGEVTGGTGEWTYLLWISIAADSTAPLHYRFEAKDLAGNTNVTGERTVEVLDDDPPWFGEDLTFDKVISGLDLTFRVEVFDNIGVDRVYVVIGDSPAPEGNAMELTREGDEWYLTLQGADIGYKPRQFYYYFDAFDLRGNLETTEVENVVVLNAPPSFADVPEWKVVEGVPSALDLGPYISDLNHNLEALSLEIDDPDVWVTGLVLRVVLDTWVPDRVLEVWVSDGFDSASTTITMTVENVNDAPEITNVTPESGLRFTKGETVHFTARATDEDGDALSFTWRDGEEVIGEGAELDYDKLPIGERTITLEVSDGTESATHTFTVVVWEREEDTPTIAIWVVILIILIVLGVLAYVVISRRRPS